LTRIGPRGSAFLLALVAMARPAEASAAAWTAPAGSLFLKLGSSFLSTDAEYNHRGDVQDIFAEDPARSDASYREMALTAYAEYGVARGWTIVAATEVENVRTREDIRFIAAVEPAEAVRTNYGAGDLRLSIRRSITDGPVAVALQPGLKIPLGYDSTPGNDGAPLGTGRFDGELLAGAGFPLQGGLYLAASAGYRSRGGRWNDQRLAAAELGAAGNGLFGKVRLEGTWSTVDPPDVAGRIVEAPAPASVLNEVIVGDYDLVALVVESTMRVGPGLHVGAGLSRTLSGKNALEGTTWTLGVVRTVGR
jgi:hypothetical protein